MSRKREIKRQNRINNQMQNQPPVRVPCNVEVRSLSSKLLISPDFQRRVKMNRARKIAREWDESKMNIIKVSFRDGVYNVFDGAHTLMAMKILHGNEPFDVPCRVYHGLSYQQEATLFAEQGDNVVKVPFSAKMAAHIKAENPEQIMFRDITHNAGFNLGMQKAGKNATINAMEKAWGIYQQNGPEFYERMLKLIGHTWNGVSWSLQGPILGGIAVFMKKFPYFNEKRFIKKLSAVDQNLLKRESSSVNRNSDISYAVAIAHMYNANGGRGTVNAELLIA